MRREALLRGRYYKEGGTMRHYEEGGTMRREAL